MFANQIVLRLGEKRGMERFKKGRRKKGRRKTHPLFKEKSSLKKGRERERRSVDESS